MYQHYIYSPQKSSVIHIGFVQLPNGSCTLFMNLFLSL